VAKADLALTDVKGQRIFTCGHSFHMFVYRQLNDIAAAAGIKGHEGVGSLAIGGSRVIQHWDVPEAENKAKAALRAGQVDVLTLSPIWLPDEGIENFARLALEHNPNIRVTVQEYWLPNDEFVPVYPLQTFKQIDHDAITGDELRKRHAPYFQDMDNYIREVNDHLGRDVAYAVAVGQAVNALREMIIAGQVPGLKSQSELFTDSWGHPALPVQVLAAYCHYAVIYRRSPAGVSMPSVLAQNPLWDDRLNHLLQELAWDAVTRHPLSGVAHPVKP
jgi:hypothetical protein